MSLRWSGGCLVVTAVAWLGFSGAAGAATFSVGPAADAFVTTGPADNLQDNNYGAAGALSIAAPGSPKGEFQSVLKFDALGARSSFDALFGPGLWTVQSVSLQLTATTPNNAIFNANAAGMVGVSWMQNDTWAEGSGGPSVPSTTGISYNLLTGSLINNAADQSLGSFSYGGGTGLSTYSLNLASGLINDIESGSEISLRLFAADPGMSYLVNSRNFPTASSRPLLNIEAVPVPEPALAGLLGLLLGAFAICRWSGRKR